MALETAPMVAVIIPCYRVKNHILKVLGGIGPEVSSIYIIDDGCPDGSGDFVLEATHDDRISVVKLGKNRGVGGATKAGYCRAMTDGAEIMVKLDGDNQMDGGLIPHLVRLLIETNADYVKGNRFSSLRVLKIMPLGRLIGNLVLSVLSKFSSGYWGIVDSTNGYTAIRSNIVGQIPLCQVDNDYFFESDMLYWLHTVGASVVEIPMEARYGNERSNLNIAHNLPIFARKHVRNMVRRFRVLNL